MKIQIASDLHLERVQAVDPGWRVIEPAPDADVLVLAGDIGNGLQPVQAFADWPVPVLLVPGNHEAYGGDLLATTQALREAARGTAVTVLCGDGCTLGGVHFVGTTLWADHRIVPGLDAEAAMALCDARLADARTIRLHGRPFTARDAVRLHRQQRAWLRGRLEAARGTAVVITHHGVHPGSIHARFAGSPVNAGFVSDLSELLPRAALWIHGHVHDSCDYRVGGARVLANPRGYALRRWPPGERAGIAWENPAFDPGRVVAI